MKTNRRKRWIAGMAATVVAGMVFQTACIGFGFDQLQRTIDFCFIFDCTNGAFGGVIQPCKNNDAIGAQNPPTNTGNLFLDCPPPAN